MTPGRHTIARLLNRTVGTSSRPAAHPAGVRPSAPQKPTSTRTVAAKPAAKSSSTAIPAAKKPAVKKPSGVKSGTSARTSKKTAVPTPVVQTVSPVLLAARTAPVTPQPKTSGKTVRRRRRTPGPAAVALPAVLLWTATLGAAGTGAIGVQESGPAGIEWSGELSARQRDALATERASREAARRALAERLLKERLAKEAAARAAARRTALALANRVVLPVSNYRLTARFGAGGGLWSRDHTGLDFATRSGSPVRAVKKGRVVEAGYDGAYGNKIVIRHDDGTETWYCHLSSMSVRSGSVAAGQRIGRVGSTGNTTGPHLHLEVRINDNPVDPYRWLRARGARP